VWILAREPVIGDGGTNALRRLAKLGASTVLFVPVAASAAPPPELDLMPSMTPPTGAQAVPITNYSFDLYSHGAINPNDLGKAPIQVSSDADHHDPDDSFFQHFQTVDAIEKPEMLVAALRSASNVAELSPPLEKLSVLIAAALQQEKYHDAALLLYEIILAESQTPDAELRRNYKMAVHRAAHPALFRSLASALPRAAENRLKYVEIIGRYGDDAVEALIEQLAYAELAKERRVLFDAIVQIRHGVPTLIKMLSDKRWYVARNAAELLGEMGASDAESTLVRTLRHDDVRVRKSAAAALAKLGSRGAVAALKAAMHDASPNVRMQATIAVATRKDPHSTPMFIRALTEEEDPNVQKALLSALGKLASPDAVKRLISDAEPDGRFFRRKPTPTRVAAVQALAEAGTPEAMAALESLTKDRSREVREAAVRGLAERENRTPPNGPKNW
jgi:HEAT repeat protein